MLFIKIMVCIANGVYGTLNAYNWTGLDHRFIFGTINCYFVLQNLRKKNKWFYYKEITRMSWNLFAQRHE